MRLTVDGLLASQLLHGIFPYGFDFQEDQPLEPGLVSSSNFIRQAGTVSALAQYNRHFRDARLVEPIRRALEAFGRHSLPVGKSRMQGWVEQTRLFSIPFGRWKLRALLDRLGLLYEPVGDGKLVSPDGTYPSATAGTVALVLLAELLYADATGDQRFAGQRSAWFQGLLTLHIPGGGFRRNPESIEESDYYNGEAWLAIAVYCDLHGDDAQAAAVLSELDQAMIERYSRYHSRGFYHWGAMAAAQRYATTRDPRFMTFLKNQTDLFFDNVEEYGRNANLCAEMEGLAAALAVLNRSGEGKTARAREIREWLSQEAKKLPRLQLQSGQVDMVLKDGTVLHAPRMSEFPGAFLWSLYQPSIRVDAAQHCLSAMTMVERDQLLEPSK